MTDRLDYFLNLLINKESVYNSPVKNLLMQLQYNTEAFLFIYENLPKENRPSLDDKHFRDCFFKVIINLPEKEMNHYLFSGLEKNITPENLRELSFKHPQNKKLYDYVKTIDNPVKIDDMVRALHDFYFEDKSRFDVLWSESLEKLKNLKNIKTKKSYAIENYLSWMDNIINTEGLEKALEISKSINLNLGEKYFQAQRPIGGVYQKLYKNLGDYFLDNKVLIEKIVNDGLKQNQIGYSLFEVLFSCYNLPEAIVKKYSNNSELSLYLWQLTEEKVEKFLEKDTYIQNLLNSSSKPLKTTLDKIDYLKSDDGMLFLINKDLTQENLTRCIALVRYFKLDSVLGHNDVINPIKISKI